MTEKSSNGINKSIRHSLLRMIQEIAPEKSRIDDSTCLYHDLSVSGDDAVELLDKVHREFNTAFDGFSFEVYFPNETEAIYLKFAKLFGYRGRRKRLTFGHLLRVVENGRWFEAGSGGG